MIDASLAEVGLATESALTGKLRPTGRAYRSPRRYELSPSLREFLTEKYLRSETVASGFQAIDTRARMNKEWGRAVERTGLRDEMSQLSLRRLAMAVKLFVLAATLLVLVSLAFSSEARADTVVLTGNTTVQGSQGNQFTFDAPGAGTLDIQLTGLPLWNDPLVASWDIWSPTQVYSRGCSSDPCSLPATGNSQPVSLLNTTIQTTGAGAYYAFILAQAGGLFGLGEYSLNVNFVPLAAVPLPASFWLVLAGIVATAWSLHRRDGSRDLYRSVLAVIARR